MDQHTAKKLIDKTRDDYNLIADQFASTRKYNWPDISAAIKTLGEISDSAKILEVGCGAGRSSEYFPKKSEYIGLDLSPKLIEIASKTYKNRKFLVGNATSLPFPSDSFNIVISIATLHHIPSTKLRNASISEIFRVLKPGSQAVLTVWNFWQLRDFRYLLPWVSKKLGPSDFMMSWKTSTGKQVTERYFHAWTKIGLHRSLKAAGFTEIHNFKFSNKQRNLIFICKKPL